MIAIVKYNGGNTTSVVNAVQRLGYAVQVTDDAAALRAAEKVIFPGVGHAGRAMEYLRQRGLDEVIKNLRQPVLGICLGMQLLCSSSAEGDAECEGEPGTEGMAVFNTAVERLDNGVMVPHMGWNAVEETRGPLFNNISAGTDFYFIHSYCAGLCDDTAGVCDYGGAFSAALQRDNFYGVQFHPEKSADAGAQLLDNFLKL